MPDNEDESVPFSSHLDELRRRLVWSVLGIGVAFLVAFGWFADDVVRYIKGIAVVSHDVAATQYPDFKTAVQMPFRAPGSTWTMRHEDGTTTSYEVLRADRNQAEVRRIDHDPDGNATGERTFTRTFDAEAAAPPESVLLHEQTISVPAGEFDCFVRTVTEGDRVTRTWVARSGGVPVRVEREEPGLKRVSELASHELKSFEEETFSTTMRVSFYAALVFAYPWVMLQAYLFIAPGLYRRERQFFRFAIPAIFVLFFAGAAFGRYVLLPISIPFLLGFNVESFDVDTNYSLGQFLGLVFAMTFGLGFIFQIPLLVAPLVRFGLVSPEFFQRKRRYTILVAVIIGAIVSPSGSPIDMILAGLPVFFLVEGGVWMGRVWKAMALRRAQKLALEAAKRGETIDPEELAGGLAIDLEKKLAEFAKGGAREFARELFKGFRESGRDIETIFDDDYKDDDKPPVEVKLKPRPKKEAPETEVESTTTDERNVATQETASPPEPEPQVSRDEAWPDRPWDENVNEDLARYIEDRISQRLTQFLEQELRPWMDRIEHELKDRNGEDT
jgi:Tat protein translocase TatC